MAMGPFRGRSLGWPARSLPRRAGVAAVGTAEPDRSAGVALGEELPDTSSCPACGRPLEALTGVCAGCGTLLVIGVQARRAALFVAFGLVAGLLVGSVSVRLLAPPMNVGTVVPGSGAGGAGDPGGTSAVAGEAAVPAGDSGAAAGAAGAGALGPSGPAGPGPTAPGNANGGSTGPNPSVPRAAADSLRQLVAIDVRLRASAGELDRILAARPFDPVAAAQSLRDVAADASVGAQYPPGLAAWPAAAAVRSAAAGFYEAVLAIARDGLSFSVADAGAYESAAVTMTARFRSLETVDATARTLAAAAGIEVAPAGLTPPRPSTTP